MTFRQRAHDLVAQMTVEEKMSQMRFDSPAIPRLGIPAYVWWNECLHGVARQGTATVFPQAIGMAASFDTELIGQVATAISDEARAKYNEYRRFGYTEIYQGLTYWSPNINIFRDPRWGRGQETYGEDPYLTARMGTAFVKGLQGEGPYRKVDATLKHYAVHSGPEGLRHSFDAHVSERDLRETYLYAFEYIIRHAKPAAVMGAYNRVFGEPACASKRLLRDILYGEWGFEGYVVSDCGAIRDFHEHHKVTSTPAESAALAVSAGCQLNCGYTYEWLAEALERGMVTEEVITEAVERLFEARFALGMFDRDCPYDAIPFSVVDSREHRALNRRMAARSMVLLKNDGLLPLDPACNVAVIGPNADDRSVLLGNYNGTPAHYTTLLRGIEEAAQGRVYYARGCDVKRGELGYWEEHPTNEALICAKQADVVILCMGLCPSLEGEEGEALNDGLVGDRASLELPAVQQELIRRVLELGKPTVFVNVSGSCVNLSVADEGCGAVLQCFYPGAEGGHALADILYGRTSPSGRLPVTFYRTCDDLPPFEDYSMEGRTYKFYRGQPLYPFGHGLSYAKVTEEWTDERTVRVTNHSDFACDFTVLRYEYIPHKNLCGFTALHLEAGETKTVTF